MVGISEILDMIDWNKSVETQSKGISLASEFEDVFPFIQPLTPKHNKNVWENCATIISQKNDEEIRPYLGELLEWLQDMNWPGAFCILDRLRKYSDRNTIFEAINTCIKKAKENGDDIWNSNLHLLFDNTDDGSM